ncbi:MAG: hypothetical protein ACOC3V_01390 [bacterium]
MTTFGDSSIDIECFNKILEILPKNKTILEFGSGEVTEEFRKYYQIFSIEHDINWIKNNETYIHAPLKPLNNKPNIIWYDVDILKNNLPNDYDLILIDGPIAWTNKNGGRFGFYYNLNLFNLDDVIIVFDDIQRNWDMEHMILVANKLKRNYKTYNNKN